MIAALEVTNEGITKGRIYEVRTLLAHIGRGAHNDVMIADDSVSDTHAKLQRRDDGWYVVDMGSTNGTYVAGTRITGERRLDGTPDVRFGGMKMRFTPAEAPAVAGPTATEPKGTRAIASVERPRKPAAAPTPVPADAPATRSGSSALVWVLLALVAAAALFFVLRRPA